MNNYKNKINKIKNQVQRAGLFSLLSAINCFIHHIINQVDRFNKINAKSHQLRSLCYILPLSLLAAGALYSCKGSKESLTQRLFMQSKRVNLELPTDRVDSLGNAILSEKVSYQNEDNTSQVIIKEDSIRNAQRSINEMQYLNEVTVTARVKQKFAPERDGRVNVDFVVRVPKELLSADYRMQLFPKLLHNDSIVPLDPLNLKGANFLAKQEADSIAYGLYIGSIIGTDEYDKLFLDRKGIAKDMYKRQELYWDIYNKEMKHIKSYYRWKNKLLERYARYNTQMEGRRLNLYHKYMRDARYESVELLVAGRDTTGIDNKYTKKFEKRAKLLPQYHLFREIKEKNVPGKYKAFFLNEPDLSAIDNYSTTEKDSVEIAKHRYFFEQIAENEAKDKNRDLVKEQMIPFPFETGMRLDSLVSEGNDFVYYYTQDYPVTPGLKSIRIAMDGKVIATDRSSYTLAKSDTLNYVISSLVQLADTSLIIKKTKLYRNMYDKMTIYPQFETNKSDFNIEYSNGDYSNRQEVDTLMSRYRKLTVEMGLQMDSMVVTSWASLDGSYDTNYELSRKKAESLSQYLQSNYPQDISYNTIKVIPRGEDWQGLVNELKTRNDIDSKEEVLNKILEVTYPDQTEQEIRWGYKKAYKVIRQEIYPKLRRMDISFHVSRPEMVANDTIQQEVKAGYEEGLRLLMDRQYWEALEILKDYPDYNAALCLACMGYNGRAYDLLLQLTPTGNSEYLLAIVTQRMDKEEDAVNHLLKAVELDNRKAYRWQLDSEVIALVNKYNLRGQIEAIANKVDEIEPEKEQDTTEQPEHGEETGQTQQGKETTSEESAEKKEETTQQGSETQETSENQE